MFHKSSRKIVNHLLKNETICESDYEIYLFGMEQLLMNVFDIITVLLIGVILNMFFHTIFFVVAFMLLRSYAGGYHASTPVRCYLLTTTITIIALSVMKFINFDGFVLLGLYIVASIVILILAPVGTKNKPLDMLEIIYYTRKIKLVWGLESVSALMCGILQFQSGTKGIVFAQVIELYDGTNVSDAVSATQGNSEYYKSATSQASKATVYLTAENNNYNGSTYWVSGVWDEETGVILK